jgi:hypothetical protein
MPQFFIRNADGSETTLEDYRALLQRLIAEHERKERIASKLRECLAATYRISN